MADIDKSLPNAKRPEEVAEEINVEEIQETGKGPVEITEDEEKKNEKEIQVITDKFIKLIDDKVSSKEKEIMTI